MIQFEDTFPRLVNQDEEDELPEEDEDLLDEADEDGDEGDLEDDTKESEA